MSEQTPLADKIAADLSAVTWPAPEQIRARGRRRRLATVAAVPLVVLALVIPVSLVARQPEPRPAPAPAVPAPPRVQIPSEALLQPRDVGPGLVVDRVETADLEEFQLLWPNFVTCEAYQGLGLYAGPFTTSRAHAVQRPPKVPDDPATGELVVSERVTRLPRDGADRAMADLERLFAACGTHISRGEIPVGGRNVLVAVTHQWSQDTRTAANGVTVVLLSHTMTLRRQADRSVVRAPTTRWTALVRVGDLVAEVTPDEAVAARLPDLALVAAARLCVAANPGC